jgi:heme-degrading monooxygenase HmoA
MEFDPQKVDDFLTMFDTVKEKIKAVEGCERLTLYRDLDQPNVMFTYSFWQKEEHLEAYRTSDLFVETWKYTKSLFASRAQAWSVEDVVTLL